MKRKVIYIDKMTEQLMDDLSQIWSILNEISRLRHGCWMDVKEAAKCTKESEKTIRRAIANGEIEVSRKTGKLFIQIELPKDVKS